MSTNFINQWVEMTQASFDTLKQMSESNMAGLTTLRGGMSPADTSELLKTYTNSAQKLSEINTTALATLFRSQLNFLNLGVSTTASQELSELSSNFIKELVQQQTQFSGEFTELFAGYLTELQKAKGIVELKTLQMDLFGKIEQKLKDHTKFSLELLNTAKESTTAWSEKHLSTK